MVRSKQKLGVVLDGDCARAVLRRWRGWQRDEGIETTPTVATEGGKAHRNGGGKDKGVRPMTRKTMTAMMLGSNSMVVARLRVGHVAQGAPPEGPQGFKLP